MKCLTSRTYTIDFLHEDVIYFHISTGSGYWTFLFAKEGADLSPVNVTFNIDMSNTETSLEGVFLAGGDAFGSPGDNLDDTRARVFGEHVYTITKQISAYYFGNYIFTNGSSAGWDAKEQLGGQDCADGDSYNDRLLYTMNEDVTINGCFGLWWWSTLF